MWNPCWAERMEIDPRYDYREDTFDENAPLWSPHCGHAVCLKEDALHKSSPPNRSLCSTPDSGWDCPMATCRWDTAHATCSLDDGHDGEHEFIPTSEIMLVFPSQPTAAEATTP